MNNINLKGIIKDIQPSHTIDNISFDKAKLICKRTNGREDIINLRFKSFTNNYEENSEIELKGNIRSYSYKVTEDKNKVTIYVFTYFDESEDVFESNNIVHLTGRICKMNELRNTYAKKLSNSINAILEELEMKNAKINIHVDYNEEQFYENGKDEVEFYIRTNLGEDEKELSKLFKSDDNSAKTNIIIDTFIVFFNSSNNLLFPAMFCPS